MDSTTGLVRREWHGQTIGQREDGYFDLTAMAKANGKKAHDYLRTKSHKEFVAELATNTGIPALDIVHVEVGGDHSGTWGHPLVACHMAQWCSAGFSVQVARWVDDLRTKGVATVAPLGPVGSNLAVLRGMLEALESHESRLLALERERAEGRAEIAALPPADGHVEDATYGALTEKRIKSYAHSRGLEYGATFREFFDAAEVRVHVRLSKEYRKRGQLFREAVDSHKPDVARSIYNLACEMFGR